jgi:hypothetical protein
MLALWRVQPDADVETGGPQMTDAQIEAIARAYCVKLGLDPDERIWSSNGAWIPHGELMWRIKARQVREAIAMRAAIQEVLGDMEGKG